MKFNYFTDRYCTYGLLGTDASLIHAIHSGCATKRGPGYGIWESNTSSGSEKTSDEAKTGEMSGNIQDMASMWRTGGLSSAQVMHTIRSHCKQRRLRVKEFFKDADPHCKGTIEVTKFRRGMKLLMSGSDVTTKQLMIEDRYCASGDLRNERSWASGQPTIDWRSFTKDVESVNTIANLEQNPTADVMAMTSSLLNEGYQSSSTLPRRREDVAR